MASVLNMQTLGGATSPALAAWSTVSGSNCGKKGWSTISGSNCGNLAAFR
jgi:hypothetical protein